MVRGKSIVNFRFRHFAWLLTTALFLLVASAAAGEQDRRPKGNPAPGSPTIALTSKEQAWLRAHPVIRVATEASWPPIDVPDERGEPSGISGDYLRLVERRLGVKFERSRNLTWQQAYARLKSRESDITTSMAATPERLKLWAFTKPYMEIPIILATGLNVPYLGGMGALEGKTVAMVEGYAINEWVARDYPKVRIVPVKDAREGLEALRKGEVFAYADNLLVVGYYISGLRSADLKISGETGYVNRQCLAVRKDWSELTGILQKAVDSITEAEREEIFNRWVTVRYDQRPDYTHFWQWLAGVGLLLAVVLFWTWRLAKEVKWRSKAELALAKTAENLSLAQKAASLGVWNWDMQTGALEWTGLMYAIFGLERTAPASFETWRKALHPEDLAIAEGRISAAVRDKKPLSNEYRVIWPDGSVHWIEALGNAFYDASGKACRMAGTCRDITERRRTEGMLRDIIERNPISIQLVDKDGFTLKTNSAHTALFGSVPPAGFSIFTDLKRKMPDFEKILLRAKNGEAVSLPDIRYNAHDAIPEMPDNPVWVHATLFQLKDANHEIFVFMHENITERKDAAASLQESKDLIESVVENVPLMLFLKEAKDLKFVVFNHAGEELLGYDRKALLGKSDLDFFPPEQAAHFMAKDREVLEGDAGALDIPEEFIDTAKKGRRTLHTHKVSIKGHDGKPKYLLGISEDITEQLRLERQFQQSQKMESIGRLAGGVAHDFNNLLTAIGGYAGFLYKGFAESDPRRDDAKEIISAAERAAALTRQLLAFSRKQVLNPQAVDINATLAGTANMLKRLIGENIELQTKLYSQPCIVNADAGQLGQVLMNLVINSRDAMPDGGKIIIETKLVTPDMSLFARHPDLNPGPQVCLSVSDTGSGISAENKEHLFEPFFTTKEKGKGTGLGLSTVFGIVKQSGGEIEVESSPGQGTTFRIYVPQVRDAAFRNFKANEQPKSLGGTETILLVEDEDSLRRFAERTLRAGGYTVVSAEDGKAALAAAELHGQPFDMLLTDVVMPGMNGRELSMELARRKMVRRTLYMSGYTDDAIIKHGVLEDGISFIYKPFSVEALSIKIREVLDGTADQAKA